VPSLRIEPAETWLPDRLDGLAEQASAEDIRIVARVVSRWRDGSERFDGPGERLYVAVDHEKGVTIGIGGLAQCPDVPGALRMRRFYVAPLYRRHGVARGLAQRLIEDVEGATTTLTCNARASAAAPPFWESMGFEPVDAPGITHLRHLSSSGPYPT
jgi:GNAT superfamily N-acetyltransferase